MIRAKSGTKIIIVDETEELAKRYEKTPGTSDFYRNRREVIMISNDPLHLNMKDVKVQTIAHGDLCCLSFRELF